MLAIPNIIANLTVPLLGAVDMAVIGNLSAAHLGAVTAGATIFAFLYWLFVFLRMATTGLTAQAHGRGAHGDIMTMLGRAGVLAVAIGLIMLVFQAPIIWSGLALIAPSQSVMPLAETYTNIRIWGAPAALFNMAMVGWLLGMQRAGTALLVQAIINGTNMALDWLFVPVLGFDIAGVAWATVCAQYTGALVGLWIAIKTARRLGAGMDWAHVFNVPALMALMAVNRDIMIRTFLLIVIMTMFTIQGAALGDLTLAANGILVLFISFLSHGLDGFAHAAEALVGSAAGARNRLALRAAVWVSTMWAVATAALYTLAFLAFGALLIALITDIPEVQAATMRYWPWMIAAPLVTVWSYQLDGIFVGATASVAMRNAMVMAAAVYFPLMFFLKDMWGNHGVWAAFTIFMIIRAIALGAHYPGLERKHTSQPV